MIDGQAIVASDEPRDAFPIEPGRGQRRGILVVDDEPAHRDILQTYLQGQGFRVLTAANGEEALDHCCDHGDEIAVILLDVRMPGLDGPQTLDGIRELDIEIPVCFMTGSLGDYESSALLRLGACHLFEKPLLLDEIARVVLSLASQWGSCKRIDTWDTQTAAAPFFHRSAWTMPTGEEITDHVAAFTKSRRSNRNRRQRPIDRAKSERSEVRLGIMAPTSVAVICRELFLPNPLLDTVTEFGKKHLTTKEMP